MSEKFDDQLEPTVELNPVDKEAMEGPEDTLRDGINFDARQVFDVSEFREDVQQEERDEIRIIGDEGIVVFDLSKFRKDMKQQEQRKREKELLDANACVSFDISKHPELIEELRRNFEADANDDPRMFDFDEIKKLIAEANRVNKNPDARKGITRLEARFFPENFDILSLAKYLFISGRLNLANLLLSLKGEDTEYLLVEKSVLLPKTLRVLGFDKAAKLWEEKIDKTSDLYKYKFRLNKRPMIKGGDDFERFIYFYLHNQQGLCEDLSKFFPIMKLIKKGLDEGYDKISEGELDALDMELNRQSQVIIGGRDSYKDLSGFNMENRFEEEEKGEKKEEDVPEPEKDTPGLLMRFWGKFIGIFKTQYFDEEQIKKLQSVGVDPESYREYCRKLTKKGFKSDQIVFFLSVGLKSEEIILGLFEILKDVGKVEEFVLDIELRIIHRLFKLFELEEIDVLFEIANERSDINLLEEAIIRKENDVKGFSLQWFEFHLDEGEEKLLDEYREDGGFVTAAVDVDKFVTFDED